MKDKIINFLLIFLLVFLTINLFNNNSKKDEQKEQVISLQTESSYTIPASIKINISNDTPNTATFNTCSDLQIKKDSKIITPSECNILKMPSWAKYTLDLSKEYSKFFSTWEYFVILKHEWNDILTKFQIENKWFFSKFFIFFFYAPIYNLMALLLEITNFSLWLSIILITIIIRLILLYPQHRMMVSQRKLQLLQPKIKEIQEKYKWNNQALWMEMLKLYKDEKVNPFSSFGLLLIQMPILIVIYHIILSIQSYSNMYYLYSFIWEYSVSMIKNVFLWFDLLWVWWINWAILAVVVWALQYIQIKLSLHYNNNKQNTWVVLEKKKDANDYQSFMPDPELMNKFMLYWLPVMIMVATYTFFAWVWLYWGIWTLFMIIQQMFVNKILKK